MTNSRFSPGSFVFTRARGLDPRLPEEILPLASRHGLPESFSAHTN